jgi:hypothetical protein
MTERRRNTTRIARAAALAVTAALAVALLLPTLAPAKQAPTTSKRPEHAHSTTGPTPPKNVVFKRNSVGGSTGSLATYSGGLGEVLIAGVPAYSWRDGCGPTALGMVIGFYDVRGFDDLIPGSAATQTEAVLQAIASRGTTDVPRHREDYALPLDGEAIAPDRSELPAGDEHASDCIADFMRTSWSIDRMRYGWSYLNNVTPAFQSYVALHLPGADAATATFAGSKVTWELIKQEVDAQRPMVLLVDSAGDGRTDHFVTLVGYREINGYPEYACWDTWSTTIIRWERFRPVSSTYAWGVAAACSFSLQGSAPPPDPDPSPSPSPSPTEPPADTTPPVTVAHGVTDDWSTVTVTVSFAATDDASGVAYTEYRVDGGDWTAGDQVTFVVPRKRSVGRVYTLDYRSADAAGNVATAKTCQVKLDSLRPATADNATDKVTPGTFNLVLSPSDSHSGVATTYYSVDDGPFKEGTSANIKGSGTHTVTYFSRDRAGNAEALRTCKVRIK